MSKKHVNTFFFARKKISDPKIRTSPLSSPLLQSSFPVLLFKFLKNIILIYFKINQYISGRRTRFAYFKS
jgi:hypothetical protein